MNPGRRSDAVTVVMATRDRAEHLKTALGALARLEYDRLDLIVVDDGSTDETMQILEAQQQLARSNLRAVHRDESRGPAAARNIGWAMSDATWIAFTDDDCEPRPDWLRRLVEAARETGADMVQGRTIPDPTHGTRGCWDRTASIPTFSNRYQTCNLLVRRTLLAELGGFDEAFTFAGEDADFGWRARAIGARTAFAADAVVCHAIRPCTFRQHLRDRSVWADLAKFYKHHPEARGLLVGRIFYRTSHIVVLAGPPAVAAAATVAGPWVIPVSLGAYICLRAVRHGRADQTLGRRLMCASQGVLSAFWETIQFARASARYRTLVL